ncbi:hypothetical protein F8N49_22200 [Pseudomonas sp. GXM4]|jgi:hypothetical protein|uniref:hypothetical protein n=1 Tax=Pseudomonas sp. GXM4 TaxID=2651867 RepID=UPI00124D71EC|nr:hypothetical protein [Pseudomonas sp. GXM4]KAB2518415.1 hypothetical protein F8N49_22200 [Pseudomonas sp. GXM4]
MQVEQPSKPPYLITAQWLINRLTLIARQQGMCPTELTLDTSIGGWQIPLNEDNFHVTGSGCLIIRMPARPIRIKHYNVCVFGQRLNVVLATDYDNLRRELCVAQQRVERLEARLNPPDCASMPYV